MRNIGVIFGFSVVALMSICAFGTTEKHFLKTKLHVTVRNILGNLVQGAQVSIYVHKLSQNSIAVDSTDA